MAQWIEHPTSDRRKVGSSPSGRANTFIVEPRGGRETLSASSEMPSTSSGSPRTGTGSASARFAVSLRAPVAQWIEHDFAEVGVGGSSPSRRANSLFPLPRVSVAQVG